jgi:hypothetical protein
MKITPSRNRLLKIIRERDEEEEEKEKEEKRRRRRRRLEMVEEELMKLMS